MRANDNINFTKVAWDKIDLERLQFYFREAVEANDAILNSINNLNNKAYQFLAMAGAMLAALTGFLLAIWGETGKEAIAHTMICGCVGLGLIMVALLLAVFPRTIYLGRATPGALFSGTLYKEPMTTHYADGIASYHKYIRLNRKVEKFRSSFLTVGMIGFFLVPLITILLLLWVF